MRGSVAIEKDRFVLFTIIYDNDQNKIIIYYDQGLDYSVISMLFFCISCMALLVASISISFWDRFI